MWPSVGLTRSSDEGLTLDITSVSDELKQWYLTNCENGHLSWKTLSNKTGVTVSNISKIARGEVHQPKYETAKVLLEAVLPKRQADVLRFLRAEYPDKVFNFVDSQAQTPRATLRDTPQKNELLEDELTYRLYKLSLGNSYEVEKLKVDFGRVQVESRIAALEKAELVVSDDGVLRRAADLVHTQQNETSLTAKHFRYNVNMVSMKKTLAKKGAKHIDTHANRMLFYHFPLTEEALAMMVNDTLDFISGLAKKYNDEKYHGSVVGFIDITTGRFDDR